VNRWKIALMTHGGRGDVQPMVALAAELARRGHSPVLAVPSGAVDFVRGCGLVAEPLPGDWQAYFESPEADRTWMASGDTSSLLTELRRVMADNAAEIARTLGRISRDADVIVSGMLTEDVAAVLAEALRIPLALLHMFPVRPTDALPNCLVSTRISEVPGENLATHELFERSAWEGRRDGINRMRAALGLPPTDVSTPVRASRLGAVEIQTYSPNVVRGLDWPPSRPVIGWMELNGHGRRIGAEAGLPADLERWLEAGPAPVYVGFGSSPIADPAATVRMVEDVMRELGLRAVVASGWGALPDAAVSDTERIRVVDSVDHSALLPRCRAAVHHGGSGTVAATLRAGLPMMACSVLLDHAMWGELVARSGVGVHQPFRELTRDSLLTGVRQLLDPHMVGQAGALGKLVCAEPDAVCMAADIILDHVGNYQPGGPEVPGPP